VLPVNNKLVKGTDPVVPEIIDDTRENETGGTVRIVTIIGIVTAVVTEKAGSITEGRTRTRRMTLDHQIMTDATTERSRDRLPLIISRPKSRKK
jgi:hypothetical protein